MDKETVRAMAILRGGSDAPNLAGIVILEQLSDRVRITVKVAGLPHSDTGFFALHIHEGTSCQGEAFAQTGAHYNPSGLPHPRHAGDLPVLLSCAGKAYLTVDSDRFTVGEIIGRTVVIHSDPDDFTSQPAGNAGTKIACGVIQALP